MGNIEIQRDWGWSPEYVEAMWLMLQQDHPDDYVVATGETYSLREFVDAVFTSLGLRWHDYVVLNQALLRPTEILISRSNPRKAEQKLAWKARYKMKDVACMMVEAKIQRTKNNCTNTNA